MTVVHTYFYTVVDTQRGCGNLKKNLKITLVKKAVVSVVRKFADLNCE
jgi:hypothetical protein